MSIPQPTDKQLVMVARVGPAFSTDDNSRAHVELDTAGVPRELDGRTLSLFERVCYLTGMLEATKRNLDLAKTRRYVP